MVVYLTKSDASEGFNQVIDFLNGSYIKYAVTVNPTIYVSCIKQFWNTVVVKQSNDVTRLQALVDRKKVVITKAAIRDVLSLDDAEGVDCLPNEEIFAELARMGYEKPSTKLTFYKAFFSSQVGKGFSRVETPLFEGMLVAGVIEEEGATEEQVSDIAVDDTAAHRIDTTVQEDVAQEPSVPSPTPPTPPPQPPQDLPSTSQVQHTPPQSPQAQPQTQSQSQQATDFPMSRLQEALDACAALTRRVEHLEYDKVAQSLEIKKLKRTMKKLEKGNRVRVLKLRRLKRVGTSQRIDTSDDTAMDDESNQGRIIDEMDQDDVVALMDEKKEDKKDEEAKDEPAEEQEVVDVVTTAKLITEVVTAASETVTTASITIYTVEPQVLAAAITIAAPSRDKGKGNTVEEPKPMKKKQQVEMDEEYAKKLHEELNKDID
nr:xylulose kinase-1 [Tanacetum cinerariifolium]